ncbi:hypothetical protein D9758_004497 [Tetrapyrgos nigripes]|uniref:Uncharacterized protein n=1 Tax=Tetrapyrgos nigripes TaxID=182062 RepID=A0A8H5LS59_9AGAR|nr:hypothetical protein D9758_004497 [Tetrapyrgos nigripes]
MCQFYASYTSNSPGGIALEFREGTQIDYILEKATNATDLRNRTILVDDSNPEIKWNGSWKMDSNQDLNPSFVNVTRDFGMADDKSPIPAMQPHGGGIHGSVSEGDSFVFQFAGTSITVAGINPVVSNAVLSMSFMLDSETTYQDFSADSSWSFNNGTRQGYPHFIYFQNKTLEAGNHTLFVNVTGVQGDVAAVIDYLTYTPTFTNLLGKPDFSPTTNEPPSSITTTGNDAGHGDSGGPGKGMIAGAVIGGVAFVALVLGVWYLLHRRRSAHRREYIQEKDGEDSTKSLQAPRPFLLPMPVAYQNSKGDSSPPQTASYQEQRREERRESKATTIVLAVNYDGTRDVQEITPPSSSRLEQFALIPTEPTNRNPEDQADDPVADTQMSEVATSISRGHGTPDTQVLESQMREIQSKVEMLSTEMSRYMIPPAYETNATNVVDTSRVES